MPYIINDTRNSLKSDTNKLPDNAGELNYTITEILLDYLRRKGISYQILNDIDGALGNCQKEFYRRVTAPYEDLKIKTNGDLDGFMEVEEIINREIIKWQKKL